MMENKGSQSSHDSPSKGGSQTGQKGGSQNAPSNQTVKGGEHSQSGSGKK